MIAAGRDVVEVSTGVVGVRSTDVVRMKTVRNYPKNQSVVYLRINHRVHREHRDAFKKSLCPLCSLWF
jgi:hypothetical protein